VCMVFRLLVSISNCCILASNLRSTDSVRKELIGWLPNRFSRNHSGWVHLLVSYRGSVRL
jgi:hypothetical protein